MRYITMTMAVLLGALGAVVVLARPAGAAELAPVQRWESKCVAAERKGPISAWGTDQFNEPDGWNAALKKLGAEGWEPVQFDFVAGDVKAACFKRPAR